MYTVPDLEKIKGISHAISTVDDGNLSYVFGEREEVKNARISFILNAGFDPEKAAAIHLVHGTDILVIDKNDKLGPSNWYDIPQADGMLTNYPEVVLFILTADCLPLLFFDPTKNVLGLAHAGWKGTESHMAKKMIQRMQSEFNSGPSSIIVTIGPAIRNESYIFDDPVQRKSDRIKTWMKYLHEDEKGMTSIDLIEFTKNQLLDAGVKRENIIDSQIDTGLDTRFFSHYRDSRTAQGDSGRFMTVAQLAN